MLSIIYGFLPFKNISICFIAYIELYVLGILINTIYMGLYVLCIYKELHWCSYMLYSL